MNRNSTEYHRTLSEEEVHEGRLMIMKEAVKFFPKPFKSFVISAGGKTFELALEAIDCHCRGEIKPHQHYWLPLGEAKNLLRWERGAHVTIGKRKEGGYTLESR